LVDAVEDRLVTAVIRLGDFDYGAQVSTGVYRSLPRVGDVLRRTLGLGLRSDLGYVHRGHGANAQQDC
jgi:hypothetical protein